MDAVEQLATAIDAREVTPTREELRALCALCRARRVPLPVAIARLVRGAPNLSGRGPAR